MRMVLAIRLFEFRSRKDICSLYAKLLRCTVYARHGETPRIRGNPKNQPISELDIFSKRQALSPAVVVNSNMSRGKYLAREGPGSRLAAPHRQHHHRERVDSVEAYHHVLMNDDHTPTLDIVAAGLCLVSRNKSIAYLVILHVISQCLAKGRMSYYYSLACGRMLSGRCQK